MKKLLLVLILVSGGASAFLITEAQAHRSGCHRWHSCPSDRGTYICGDLGYTSGCPKRRTPVKAAPRRSTQQKVTLVNCYDGDTCRFRNKSGRVVTVRLLGLDTPEIKGKCEAEKRLAILARNKLVNILEKALRIELKGDGKKGKYGRTLAIVLADGKDVAAVLIAEGLGVPWAGRRHKWCE